MVMDILLSFIIEFLTGMGLMVLVTCVGYMFSLGWHFGKRD